MSFFLTLYNTLSYAEISLPAAPANFAQSFDQEAIPSEFGRVNESYEGSAGKTIYFIQDAHDSLEAQENIANLILNLVSHEKIRTVFEEGYEGPVPTEEFFGFIQDPAIRRKVSYYLLDRLKIGGAEYAHINRHDRMKGRKDEETHSYSRDFQLIGADNIRLHLENIEAYRKTMRLQKKTKQDFEAVSALIEKLAHRYFSADIKEWMKIENRLNLEQIDLLSYFKRTLKLLKLTPEAQRASYPQISLLLDDPSELSLDELNPAAIFLEKEKLENDLSQKRIQVPDHRELFDLYRGIHLLRRLMDLKVTAPEFEAVSDRLGQLGAQQIAEFISLKTGQPVVFSKKWEESIQSAVRFYEISRKRDQFIIHRLDSFLHQSEENKAVLILGGFHKEPIRSWLRARDVSYHMITPRMSVSDIRHQEAYRRRMAGGQETQNDAGSAAPQASRPPSAPYYQSLEPEGERLAKAELRVIADTVQKFNALDTFLLHQKIQAALESFEPSESGQGFRAQNTRSELRRDTVSLDTVRAELRGVTESIPAQFVLKEKVHFNIPAPLQHALRLELGDPEMPISKQPHVYITAIQGSRIRLKLDIDEAGKRYVLTYTPKSLEEQPEITYMPMMTDSGALQISHALYLQPAFRAFYDDFFEIPLAPGPERKAALRKHLENLLEKNPDFKRQIPPTSTDGYIQFWGKLNLPGYYYKHSEQFAAVSDRRMQPRFIMIYEVSRPENYVIYEFYGSFLESPGTGQKIPVQRTDDEGKKRRKGYSLRLIEVSDEFVEFDSKIKKEELKQMVTGSSESPIGFHVDEAGFKFIPLVPLRIISYSGRRHSFSRTANTVMKGRPTRIVRIQDLREIKAGFDRPDNPQSVIVEGITNADGQPVRMNLKSYYNLSVVVRLVDLGELPGVYISDLARSIIAPYPQLDWAVNGPQHSLRSYIYLPEENRLIPQGHLSPFTFETTDDEPQKMSHENRAELRIRFSDQEDDASLTPMTEGVYLVRGVKSFEAYGQNVQYLTIAFSDLGNLSESFRTSVSAGLGAARPRVLVLMTETFLKEAPLRKRIAALLKASLISAANQLSEEDSRIAIDHLISRQVLGRSAETGAYDDMFQESFKFFRFHAALGLGIRSAAQMAQVQTSFPEVFSRLRIPWETRFNELRKEMLRYMRSELRQSMPSSISFQLQQPVIFVIRQAELGALSSDVWMELLKLKGIHPKMLKILILDVEGDEDARAQLRMQELRSFGIVFEESQAVQLPTQAMRIRFGQDRSELKKSPDKIRSTFYGGAFGLALLFAIHDAKLPGVTLDQDGVILDSTGSWAARAVQMLTSSYVAVSRAA